MRVLVVEDEAVIADALQRGLAAEGLVVETASDGVDGLWLAQEGDFDVVILDIMLPGLRGDEICRRLRLAGSTIPVLMLTAKNGEHDEADSLDEGADDFLAKPFSFVVLLARLRALLRRAPASRQPFLVTGSLTLDPASSRCWRAGKEVALTAREFALTEYLLRRKGNVVTRAMIGAHVWDAELDIDSKVVEVYIGYIRRKLDIAGESPLITTVRGVGYRMRDEPAPGHSLAGQ